MTSLQLFPEAPSRQKPHPIWGTGRQDASGLWVARAPTWHYTGVPCSTQYQTTSLKLSNVRDNDELRSRRSLQWTLSDMVPRPPAVNIQSAHVIYKLEKHPGEERKLQQPRLTSEKFINKPFPAEHPFTSHIAKYATFPKFDSPDDPKRGAAARQQRPISEQMPANPWQATVVKKTKGFPYREEIIRIPSEGNKKPLYWPGEQYFDQQSKVHGHRQQYYPAPPKTTAPNLQSRPESLSVSERTENVLRNIERQQWVPSHQLDYTGLGPANPLTLDNLDCKKDVFLNTGVWDDKLYPHSINTFDPSRSLEGHLRTLFAPKPAQQIMLERQMFPDSSENRRMSQTELEEYRLLNGKEYANLPEGCDDMLRNAISQQMTPSYGAHDTDCVLQGDFMVKGNKNTNNGGPADFNKSKGYSEELKGQTVQGIEARNRWKLLESATPAHDIIQLREKYKILTTKEMPATFYRHEGQYNEERAGLYKTSYDPQQLAYSMNAGHLSGGVLFNTTMSHVDASLYPTTLWDENEAALNGSRSVVFKKTSLSGYRPGTSDILNPYRKTIAVQKHMLQPMVDTARSLVQEGEFVLTEGTYGDSYNTKKFLQENKLDRNSRIDPGHLMSHENQNLERTRETAYPVETSRSAAGQLKSVHHSDNVNMRNIHENMPVRIEESHIKNLSILEREELARAFGHDQVTSISYMKAHPERPHSAVVLVGDRRNLAENLLHPTVAPTVVERNTERVTKPQFVSFDKEPQLKPGPISETEDQFRRLTTNFMPVGIKHQPGQVPCCTGGFITFDLGEKHDPRFQWEPGTGQLRPQSCLTELQDSFVKSEVHKRFHQLFPESNPDIRSNFKTGKRHIFFETHSQVLHG